MCVKAFRQAAEKKRPAACAPQNRRLAAMLPPGDRGHRTPATTNSHQSPITENQGLTAGAVARHGALRWALDSAEAARLEPVSQLE